MNAGVYRGRFAPTPSGPLHFGSLVAAAGSYLDALAHGGEWHVRIDDIDPPRVVAGAADQILRTLETFGFEWQGPVVYQRHRTDRYAAAIEHLLRAGTLYACTCSRTEIAAAGLPGLEGPRYPGTCRSGPSHPERMRALRLRVSADRISFHDGLQGTIEQDVSLATGDFVVRRADGIPSYHLACAVDDGDAGFDPIVRGADLIDSTPRQILLQRALGLPTPEYLHLPVALDATGAKLSKQTLAPAVGNDPVSDTLCRVFAFLGHPVPDNLQAADGRTLWLWGRGVWSRERLSGIRSAAAS